MNKVTAKSYTRITLALDIVGKLESGPFAGYHELATVKHRIDLHDTLTVEESNEMRIACNNPLVPTNASNICWKVVDLVKKEFGIGRNVAIAIEKNIPVQGGLAGGSANAATMFLILRDLWNLDIDDKRLIELARPAGMDVPFYFLGGTAFDAEAGGTLTPIATDLRFDAILVMPDFGVSTSEAYRGLDYSRTGGNRGKTLAMRESFLANDRAGVVAALHNDFELSVFARYPRLRKIKKRLLDAGCAGAVMSGSGSTVLGILRTSGDFKEIQREVGLKSMLVSSCSESSGSFSQEGWV
jgi:4-diphosphocytidyl-2-C-methyl-D-erythritol kinase